MCIYLLEGDAPALRTRVEQCALGELAVSAITVGEVLIGAERRNAVAQALRFFRTVPVLPFDDAAGRTYAILPFKRGSFDRLVAAHALARGLILVTNNERDFADIPGLRVENWAR